MEASGENGQEKFEPSKHFIDYGTIQIEKEKPPRQKISFLRIFLSLLLLGLVGGGGYFFITRQTALAKAVKTSYFAPYVDVTNTPYYQFQNPAQSPSKQIVLGFIVASKGSCVPSWGGYYTMAQAYQDLSLDNRIFAYQNAGGSVIASFGGQANQGLALACSSTSSLVGAYQSVLSRYKIHTMDLDIEGAALSNLPSIQRRSAALATLQQNYSAQKKPLSIWLTLPVATTGLQQNAISVVRSALVHHVKLSGINLMTMDYPASKSQTMAQMAESSISNTELQLAKLYKQYGVKLSSAQIFKRMGVTPMIGQNDISGDVFTLQDAQTLTAFSRAHGIGRISMWSINRDSSCGSSFTLLGVESTTCSGIRQSSLQFSSIFNRLNGSLAKSENTPIPIPVIISSNQNNHLPYPSWQQTITYPLGYKVVRRGNIYQAKYVNQGGDPAVDTQNNYQSAWLLIGPVLPSQITPTTTTLPPGTYPSWSPKAIYQGGEKILFDGEPYQAKWYNQANSPGAEPSNPSLSPWKPLFALPGEPPGSGNL